jgi:hypothetical protein
MTPNSQNKRKGRKQKGGKDRRKYIAKAVTYIAYENVRNRKKGIYTAYTNDTDSE